MTPIAHISTLKPCPLFLKISGAMYCRDTEVRLRDPDARAVSQELGRLTPGVPHVVVRTLNLLSSMILDS